MSKKNRNNQNRDQNSSSPQRGAGSEGIQANPASTLKPGQPGYVAPAAGQKGQGQSQQRRSDDRR